MREKALVASCLRMMQAAIGLELTSVPDRLTGLPMRFLISGTDTAGSITVQRDTAVAALKKAAELDRDGSWNITITGPDGTRYATLEFDQLAHGLLPIHGQV